MSKTILFIIIFSLTLMFSITINATTTAEALERLATGENKQAQDVAKHILANYKKEDINEKKAVGFWWHEKYIENIFDKIITTVEEIILISSPFRGFAEIEKGISHGTDAVYAHPHCAPNNPNAKLASTSTWATELRYQGFYAFVKSATRKAFEDVGFKCTQDTGLDFGQGDKALDFEFKG